MAGVLERMQDQVKTVAITQDVDRTILLAPPEFEGHTTHTSGSM